MKKATFLLSFIVLLAVGTTQAQYFNSGLKLGATFSKLRFDPDEGTDSLKSLIGPSIGYKFEIGITDNFFISPEIRTCAKGMRFDFIREKDGEWKDSKEMNIIWYIGMPVYFGYKYDLGGVKAYAMAGPTFDYGVYTTELYKVDGDWDNDKWEIGNSETADYKNWDVGFGFEVGVQVEILQIGFSYDLGMSNIAGKWAEEDDTKIKNGMFAFNIAILFGEVDGGGSHRRR